MFKFIYILLSSHLFIVLTSHGQTDSLLNASFGPTGIHTKADTTYPFRWSPLKAAIPAALIMYGVVALHSGALQDINNNFHDEIWTRHPHDKFPLDNYLEWSPGVAVFGLQLIGIKGKDGLGDLGIKYGMSFLLNTTMTEIVKKVSKEWRPDGSDRYSFPSGHTSNAFMSAELLRLEYRDVSPWYGIAGYTAATATGFLRMYNNKHWFSDILAGAGVGILSTDIVWWTYPTLKRWFARKERDVNTMVAPYYSPYTGAGLCLIHHF